jgi:4-amino-4-deoxy-L-arabinose transferase-like glycosyltransferase
MACPAHSTAELRGAQRSTLPLLLALALTAISIHLICIRNYGYFRDELYFLACAEHLDWGYVDMPPLLPAVAAAARRALGDSLAAVRLLPALAAGLNVLLAALLAREFGGGTFAQVLSTITVLIAPVYLVTNHYLSMNAFEPLFWMGCAFAAARVLRGEDPRWWLAFGLCAGLGLENKYSMFLFGFAFLLGLLLSPARQALLDRWFWIGAVLALLVYLPHLLWAALHHWPMLELLRNQREGGKYVPISPLSFALGQLLYLHPVNALVWLAGLVWLIFVPGGRPFRALGLTFVALWFMLVLLQGKDYYLAPAYPMVLAAGAVAIERCLTGRVGRWLRAVLLAGLVLAGALTAPMALPILPVETYISYAAALGIQPRGVREKNQLGPLPQVYADMFGWPELAATVSAVYHRLSADDRTKCAIFAPYNYGDAGAIDLFGPALGLPKALSGHNQYYLWGPRQYTGEVMIVLATRRVELVRLFQSVEEVAFTNHPYAMPYENGPVYLCRGPKAPLPELWPRFKHYWRMSPAPRATHLQHRSDPRSDEMNSHLCAADRHFASLRISAASCRRPGSLHCPGREGNTAGICGERQMIFIALPSPIPAINQSALVQVDQDRQFRPSVNHIHTGAIR